LDSRPRCFVDASEPAATNAPAAAAAAAALGASTASAVVYAAAFIVHIASVPDFAAATAVSAGVKPVVACSALTVGVDVADTILMLGASC